jgi:hypothetical protein
MNFYQASLDLRAMTKAAIQAQIQKNELNEDFADR